jgi:hypothetical protein
VMACNSATRCGAAAPVRAWRRAVSAWCSGGDAKRGRRVCRYTTPPAREFEGQLRERRLTSRRFDDLRSSGDEWGSRGAPVRLVLSVEGTAFGTPSSAPGPRTIAARISRTSRSWRQQGTEQHPSVRRVLACEEDVRSGGVRPTAPLGWMRWVCGSARGLSANAA